MRSAHKFGCVISYTGRKVEFPAIQDRAKFPVHFPTLFDTCPEKLQDMCRKVYRKFCSILTAGSMMCLRKCAGHSSSTALVLYQEI